MGLKFKQEFYKGDLLGREPELPLPDDFILPTNETDWREEIFSEAKVPNPHASSRTLKEHFSDYLNGQTTELTNTIEGVVDIAKGGFNLSTIGLLTNPEQYDKTAANVRNVLKTIFKHPIASAKALLQSYVSPWKEGRPLETIGMLQMAVLTELTDKGVGNISKVKKITDIADSASKSSTLVKGQAKFTHISAEVTAAAEEFKSGHLSRGAKLSSQLIEGIDSVIEEVYDLAVNRKRANSSVPELSKSGHLSLEAAKKVKERVITAVNVLMEEPSFSAYVPEKNIVELLSKDRSGNALAFFEDLSELLKVCKAQNSTASLEVHKIFDEAFSQLKNGGNHIGVYNEARAITDLANEGFAVSAIHPRVHKNVQFARQENDRVFGLTNTQRDEMPIDVLLKKDGCLYLTEIKTSYAGLLQKNIVENRKFGCGGLLNEGQVAEFGKEIYPAKGQLFNHLLFTERLALRGENARHLILVFESSQRDTKLYKQLSHKLVQETHAAVEEIVASSVNGQKSTNKLPFPLLVELDDLPNIGKY
ncbi:MAG: hypothetical protein IT291_03050 [Deltaproteobacteria bacterium]|nr:hypothetical protein [Deltaproteobacteria bacterium]